MNTKDFRIGETVAVTADWLPVEAKKRCATIVDFQTNGILFAKILWRGDDAQLYDDKYGNLFTLKELKHVT